MNQSRKPQFIQPKRCIGPSKISSILGYNRWLSREQLKHQLENGYWEHFNTRIDFGNRNENVARVFYQKHKETKVQDAPFRSEIGGRFVGKADGLIGKDGGLEIKCHKDRDVLDQIPNYYMVQIVAYMYLYKRDWWDFMSCSFRDGKLKRCKITRIYWKNHYVTWEREWLPQIKQFIKDVNWKK